MKIQLQFASTNHWNYTPYQLTLKHSIGQNYSENTEVRKLLTKLLSSEGETINAFDFITDQPDKSRPAYESGSQLMHPILR